MSIARTVSRITLVALSPLGNHTNNTPVVNNNITINSNTDLAEPNTVSSKARTDSKESTFIEPNTYNEIEKVSINPEFIDLFNKLCINLETINDYALLANIIDQTKRIIFSSIDLQLIISKFLGCEQVTINVLPPPINGGCICKITESMYLDIENIKIKSRDMKLTYNTAFNTLKDDYHICLDKVLNTV